VNEDRDHEHPPAMPAQPLRQAAFPSRTRGGGGFQVNPDLQNLIALQDIDQKIVRVQKDISDIPAKVESFQGELQRLKDEYHKHVSRSQELAKNRRAREGEVDMMQTKLSRLKDQLMAVKTNKEYTAMLHEIQMAEDQIRTAEDQILDMMEENEAMEAVLKQAEKDLRLRSAELEESIREAEDAGPRLQQELGQLDSAKCGVEHLIPHELLERYRRIADHRKGIALAEARDELCTMCHVRIRPQVYADLRQGDAIHNCDSCSRILFLRESSL
jgi:predicted  nucleic acid-binding Zn-ribbon protein